jgi:hypothetical protein
MDSKISILFIFFLTLITACSASKNVAETEVVRKPDCGLPLYVPEDEVIVSVVQKRVIYKTNKDYINKVPIQLSQDKKTIIAYPAKEDLLKVGNKNALQLENGFLLDLIGVNLNSVFTHYSLQQYQKIPTPSLEEFKKNIIELNPFEEMYICDSRYSNTEIEQFIKKGTLNTNCTKIK